MHRYNVIFITPNLDKPCIYHTDIIETFEKLCNVFKYGPGFSYYNRYDSIKDIIVKSRMKIDFIVFGTAMILYDLSIKGIESIDLPKIHFLNKEYQNLNKKLSYIKNNNTTLVATVLNKDNYYKWEKQINIPFIQIPHGVFVEKFPILDIPKKYDFGFIGGLFTRYMNYRIDLKNFIFKNNLFSKYNILWIDDPKDFLNGYEYAKILNQCKTFLSTPSPLGIVSLRSYELCAVKSLIICPEHAYNNEFIDGINCVMYNNLEKFEYLVNYYSNNEIARLNIVNNAYNDVINKWSWESRINKLISIIEKQSEVKDE